MQVQDLMTVKSQIFGREYNNSTLYVNFQTK
jgi:hypothetical protein